MKNTKRIPWEPGDCTIYDMVVAPLGEERLLLTYLNTRYGHGRSMVVWRGEAPHWTYISEKMGLGDYDSKMMARFLTEVMEFDS